MFTRIDHTGNDWLCSKFARRVREPHNYKYIFHIGTCSYFVCFRFVIYFRFNDFRLSNDVWLFPFVIFKVHFTRTIWLNSYELAHMSPPTEKCIKVMT